MFIRASQMQVRPGSMDAVIGYAKELTPLTKGMAGLIDYYLVQSGDTEVVAIGIWDSADAEAAVGHQLRGSLMQHLGPYLEGRPQNWSGEAHSIIAH